MARKIKIIVDKTGIDGFFRRARAHACALDNGEPIPDESVIAFENPLDMFRVLTTERVRLIGSLRETGETPISELAIRLGRNKRAVSRDVSAMREAGVLKTKYVTNPGHGRQLLVMPAAKKVELTSTL